MEKEFVSYEQAVALEELGSETDYSFGRFYTKPRSKMFGVDEKGRHYPIKNTPKKLYTLGEHFVLSDINVINAPLKQQVLRWFREKYGLYQQIEVFRLSEFKDDELFFDFNIIDKSDDKDYHYDNDLYSTYEEAEDGGINKLIELAKQEDNETIHRRTS
jgi:hypothetical protein